MFNYIKVILSFLNKNDIKKLNLLILLMVLAACIELVGVGAIFPYIKILGDQQIIQHNFILNYIFNFIHFKSNDSFLVFIGFVIFAMLSLKAIITCINNYYQSKFSQNLNTRISGFCIRSYLFMPYQKAMEFNTSTLSKYILTDVVYTVNVITFMLSIATDFIVALSLVSLILWVDFKIVLFSATSLTTLLLLTMKGTKKKIKNISNENEYYVRKSYNIASDAFQGLKDIKINNVETYFIEKFVFWRRKNAENMVIYNVIANVPSVLTNLVGFGILLIILLYLLFSHGNLISILPIVGIIAISIQRILPAMARISLALGNVRQYHANVLVVREALNELGEYQNVLLMKRCSRQCIEFRWELRLKDVTYQYPKSKTVTLKSISLTVPKNTSVGIVGASGAGKTTLVDVILGLLPVKSGSIFCDDIDITNSRMDLSHLVGYVPQHTHLLDGTLLDNIALGISEEGIDHEAVSRSVNISQLQNLVNDLPEGLYTQIGEKGAKLSAGQRQRVGIARALYHDPDIVIMDEATNALDSITENEFNEALKSLMGKKTLIIIAHRHSSILFCDKLVVLREGKIVSEGSHNELVKNSEIYRTLYGLESIKN
ncbi:ABC transporter ATP-binding protein [Coxiella endosymbiont of Ornithodoros maritimus]|uniref:ABC transporter ATP-binding protein n=1 Tax=Coxiella endosymbiont of Ornithodoros maritimus TaxID=1656172 RepID=UPI0022655339|nr:ABC transporter ATP-binding protein [Coxiella endosymbiont of Ornithodoros maritimus]